MQTTTSNSLNRSASAGISASGSGFVPSTSEKKVAERPNRNASEGQSA